VELPELLSRYVPRVTEKIDENISENSRSPGRDFEPWIYRIRTRIATATARPRFHYVGRIDIWRYYYYYYHHCS
jgi:hypothetical protein